ncbi:MAG: hypothetical protein R3C26_17525 [Calditrichia bacterium]
MDTVSQRQPAGSGRANRPAQLRSRCAPFQCLKVETYSSSNGCWTWMEFGNDVDMDAAYDQLRDRMERARAMLPDDLDRYYLRRFGRNDEPLLPPLHQFSRWRGRPVLHCRKIDQTAHRADRWRRQYRNLGRG